MSNRPRIDFTAIKRAVPIAKVAQMLNLPLKREKDAFRCPCPCGHGDDRALVITPGHQNKDGTLGAFYCHGDRNGGDCIGLYAHVRDVDNYAAAQAIMQHFKLNAPKRQAEEPQEPTDSLQPLSYLETQHDVLDLLGLSQLVCEALGAGYAPKGTMSGRIAIPLRLPDGKLIGYLGIATKPDQEPLLKFPPNLDEMCKIERQPAEQEPPKHTADDMRKILRVV